MFVSVAKLKEQRTVYWYCTGFSREQSWFFNSFCPYYLKLLDEEGYAVQLWEAYKNGNS
jgi:hypothetical protein